MPKKQSKLRFNRRRRNRRRYRRKKKLGLKPHSFVERVEDSITLNYSTLDSNGNLSTGYGKQFKMDDISQIASYKDLFDDYVLNKVVAEIRYDTTLAQMNVSTSNYPINEVKPLLCIKTDHNDHAGTSWNDLKESEKSRMVQISNGKKVSHVLKPAIQVEAYKTALSTAYQSAWGKTLRMIDSAVPHYGIKIQVKTHPYNANMDLGKLNIVYKYYFTCKNAE